MTFQTMVVAIPLAIGTCAAIAGPKEKSAAGKETGRILFKYYGGTNMKSEAAAHMHQAVLALPDENHYRAKWTACQNGKDTHIADLNLVRKAK